VLKGAKCPVLLTKWQAWSEFFCNINYLDMSIIYAINSM
jgi:hypothetical protein